MGLDNRYLWCKGVATNCIAGYNLRTVQKFTGSNWKETDGGQRKVMDSGDSVMLMEAQYAGCTGV